MKLILVMKNLAINYEPKHDMKKLQEKNKIGIQ